MSFADLSRKTCSLLGTSIQAPLFPFILVHHALDGLEWDAGIRRKHSPHGGSVA